MQNIQLYLRVFLTTGMTLSMCAYGIQAFAQNIPVHAQGLKEELITVDLSGTKKQAGVYSTKIGVDKPTRLAVLLPGYPGVVRPVVENGVITSSKLTGNFLIRARRHLPDDSVATLIVDCQSESGDYCSASYQASKERQEDVDKLIAEVKKRTPSISEVWLVGTSMGTISSSFMPLFNPSAYSGAIHTAAITAPYARNSYVELGNFDYKKPSGIHYFIHHLNDPCSLTPYSSAKTIAEKYNAPLVTVTGGTGFQGGACDALTQHGFRGKEKEVMTEIAAIIKSGKASQLEIN